MANTELARPGVEVVQSFKKASASFQRPTLVPCVVGPAFEVVKVLTTDGTLNQKAKYGSYAQLGSIISQIDFPAPRDNADELDVQEDSIRPFLLSNGKLAELPMSPGSGFLASKHVATQAALRVVGTAFPVGGLSLVIAIDQPVRTATDRDVQVVFTGAGSRTTQQIVDDINSAFGAAVATLVKDGSGNTTGLQLASLTYGALSSITVRATGTSNQFLGLGWIGGAAKEERVEGSGFRPQNLNNNTTVSPWIEFYKGDYIQAGTAGTAFIAGKTGLIDIISGSFDSTGPKADVIYGSSLPVQVGDIVYLDGVQVRGAEIAAVDAKRFKLGTINPNLSTVDEQGEYVVKVYDDALFGTISDATPFAPKYAWFLAQNLSSSGARTAASVTGTVAAAAATAASVTGGAPTLGTLVAGMTLDLHVTVDGVGSDVSFVFPNPSYANLAAVVTAIGTNIAGITAVDDGTGKLKLSTTKTGRLQGIAVLAGTANASLNFAGTETATGVDQSFADLTSKNLQFQFDGNAHTYDAVFAADSLDLAVDQINALVGAVVAAKSAGHLQLISLVTGVGAQVKIVGGDALGTVGFTAGQTVSNGTGRPAPDAYLDSSNNLVIAPQMVRDLMTGAPFDQDLSVASLFVQYKALRRDVSPIAKVAGVLRMPDIDTLSSTLDPITDENPLGLGGYFSMLNCPGFEIKMLGVDAVSAAAPEGTELAYARAAAMLEAEEVYAIAPLTQNEVVLGMLQTHVSVMSEPENGGERILFANRVMPTRKNAKIAASGTAANSTATPDQLFLDVAPSSGLVALGKNPNLPITATDGVYVEFSWNDVFYRYNVSAVNGALVTFRRTFTGSQNVDGFYSTAALPTGVVNLAWSMKVRGDSLTVPGSSPARLDYSLVADTVSEVNRDIGSRRVFPVFPDVFKASISGIEKALPGYYACAAAAGMVAGQPPQQGFTNLPIVGFTGVAGTEKFTKRQLNVMAGGGTMIFMQEVPGAPVICRHQLSSDTTSVETRELSITKCVDFASKFLRAGVRRFIGRQNITPVFLDSVGTTIQGLLAFLVERGYLNGAHLNNIIQDAKAPDTVLVDITLDVPFPCNYLRLTLVV